jgi:hypothetical protein
MLTVVNKYLKLIFLQKLWRKLHIWLYNESSLKLKMVKYETLATIARHDNAGCATDARCGRGFSGGIS